MQQATLLPIQIHTLIYICQGENHPFRCLDVIHSKEETPILPSLLLTQWVPDKVDFFFKSRNPTSKKAYFTEYTENRISKMSTDAICVTSIFNLYESILSFQLNYKALRSEPQWIVLKLPLNPTTNLDTFEILSNFVACNLYCQQTMPIIF